MKQNWSGQNVLIIGAARQGLALARYLCARGARVTINDQRSAEQMHPTLTAWQASQPAAAQSVRWVCGEHPLSLLNDTHLLCVSGGVPLTLPLVAEALRRGVPVRNDAQIFLEAVQTPVIGITGSAGKTTTTTLVGRMAEAHAAQTGHKVWVGGNNGLPLVEYVDDIATGDIVVMELSSFQLELMTISPHISAVLNVTPNHLDRHGTLSAYTAAKAHILQYQSSNDVCVLNHEDPGSWNLRALVRGKRISFGMRRREGEMGTYLENERLYFEEGGQPPEELLTRAVITLRGEHNLLNVLAAAAIAKAAGFPTEAIQAGVQGFGGVAHRLEYVRTWQGADWFNDSIATAPERVAADIRAFAEPLVLLLGGRDKDLPWDELAALVHRRVSHVIVFGEAAEKILHALGAIHPGDQLQSIQCTPGLQQAVTAASALVQVGDVVLLAPGGTSYDAFQDFEERGERYREWVKALL